MDKVKCMEKFEYLNAKINQILEVQEVWRTKAEKATPSLDGMPKSKGDNQREEAICEMVDCEDRINYYIGKLVELRLEVAEYIRLTGDSDKGLLKIIAVDENYMWYDT